MTHDEFRASLAQAEPPGGLIAPIAALWWDAKGGWARAHGLVYDLSTPDAMAVLAICTGKKVSSGTPTIGIVAPAANSTGRRSRKNGRRWWRDCYRGSESAG